MIPNMHYAGVDMLPMKYAGGGVDMMSGPPTYIKYRVGLTIRG